MQPLGFGKFLILEKIAQGGMAEIFKAQFKSHDSSIRTVAIKKILPQFSRDDDFIALLTDEARLMVTMNHPNIVPVIEFGVVDRDYYLALEYLEGRTLKELLSRNGELNIKMPFEVCAYILREVASGLDYAHRRTDKDGNALNIIHRDISPTNVLLSYHGEVKIVDFGISKAASQSHVTQTGIIRGKMGYMSPEQTKSYLDIDSRSDIYSAGILLWEISTGSRLFPADNINDAIRMVRKGDVPSPSLYRTDMPKLVEKIILAALDPDVNKRISSAANLRDLLNEFLAGVSIRKNSKNIFSQTEFAHYMKHIFKVETKVETKDAKVAQPALQEKGLADSRSLFTNPEYEPPDRALLGGQDDFPKRLQRAGMNNISRLVDLALRRKYRISPAHILIFGLTGIILIFRLFWGGGAENAGDVQGTYGGESVSSINLLTEPAGANVWVNGNLSSNITPLKDIKLSSGRLNLLSIQKDGFKGKVVTVYPDAGYDKNLNLTLEKSLPDNGEVTVFSDPPGADIFVNDVDTKTKTPAVLKNIFIGKTMRLTLKLPGHEAKDVDFEVDGSGRKFLDLYLEKAGD